jgi:hypothetical protein
MSATAEREMAVVLFIKTAPHTTKLKTCYCTVAVKPVYCEDVLKPGGCVMLILVVPGATGLKVVYRYVLGSPPTNTTGLVVIVPTAVFELVTTTFVPPSPGLSCATPEYVRDPGFRIDG